MKSNVLIIAEAGVNHNGDYQTALDLVKAAAEAGADFVKFQTFKTGRLVSRVAAKAAYQIANTGNNNDTQFDMLKKLEMPEEWHFSLKKYAEELGIEFLSTGFDEESVDFLDNLGVSLHKIPSGELTNKPYLVHLASKKKPLVLSTGMADMKEVTDAIDILVQHGVPKEQLTVLHCNTDYPTKMEDVNLGAMNYIAHTLNVAVGYSDHTLGIEVPVAAVALGATVIEKHFTLDKNMQGPDHAASLNPEELKAMVSAIRNIEKAVSGTCMKTPSQSESKNKVIARKSIHLKNSLAAGSKIEEADLIMIRPGDGISPMDIDNVIGKTVNKDLEAGHKLFHTDLAE